MITRPRYLVVGTGSIARRHMANLKSLFPTAEVGCVSASGRTVSAAETPADVIYETLEEAIATRPVFAIIASPAPLHVSQASQLLEADIPVLVEKPLASNIENFRASGEVLLSRQDKVEVGYNLRYLSSAQKFKQLLDNGIIGRVHSVMIDVGQYLPDWRPGTDYRKNVTARRELGGGVLLELSHELDYLGWIFGRFDTAYGVVTNSGTLDIEVEDRVDAILRRRSDGVVVYLHMDMLQRAVQRTCKVIGETGNLLWNLAENSICVQRSARSSEVLFEDPVYDRNAMYLAELAHFSQVAAGTATPRVSLEEALQVLRLVEALKLSAERGEVVSIGA